jgi:hypothetical protein
VPELDEGERRFLSTLVETVREDLSRSDDLRDEHDADAYTRSMLLEGFPMQEGGLERVVDAAGVETDLDDMLTSLAEKDAIELGEMQGRRFIRLDEDIIGRIMQ